MSYNSLRDRMCKELHDIEERGTFCRCDLDDTHKLIASINGLDVLSGHSDAHRKPDAVATPSSRSADWPTHLTLEEAKKWTAKMQNADGTKGCHWTLEQTQDVAKQRNITCDPNDFWAVMNMMYSDYCQVAKRQSVDTPGFYADMAKAFLEDADAADGKAYLYWDCIADK